MRRRSARSHSRSRSSRKTRWTGGLFQGIDIAFEGDVNAIGVGAFTWVSFWFKWPAGHFAPTIPGATSSELQQRLEPSDETLVRTISNIAFRAEYDAVVDPDQAWSVAAGLIAWDGGRRPETFDLATFSSLGSFPAPPNPVIDFSDDWILRDTYPVSATNPSLLVNVSETYLNSKAKRKLPPDTGILGVIGTANTLATARVLELSWSWDVRFAVRSGYTA